MKRKKNGQTEKMKNGKNQRKSKMEKIEKWKMNKKKRKTEGNPSLLSAIAGGYRTHFIDRTDAEFKETIKKRAEKVGTSDASIHALQDQEKQVRGDL